MAVAFSSDSSRAIENIVRTAANSTVFENDIVGRFSLLQCKNWIEENNLSKVALQIPDELQSDAAGVVKWLETHARTQCFVLADTSYGSCCVDEVSAEHCQADGVIHFGHSCLSPNRRLPTLLAFDKACIDVEDCCRKLQDILPARGENIILVYHVSCYYAIEKLHSKLVECYPNLKTTQLCLAANCSVASSHQVFIHRQVNGELNESSDGTPSVSETSSVRLSRGVSSSEKLSEHENSNENPSVCENINTNATVSESNAEQRFPTDSNSAEQADRAINNTNYVYCCGRRVNLGTVPLEKHRVVYIGDEESLTLSNLMLLWHGCEFYSYSPLHRRCRQEGVNTNKALMKRFYLVEKAKDAQIVGIVVGTLGVANYLQVIERMKVLLKKSGKKHYTFVVGKLNVAKLANFMEIDIFVLVACQENSLLDSSEFYKPIITPYELELACNPSRQWTGGIITDYQEILPGGRSHVTLPDDDIEEQHDVSLVTGEVRKIGVSKSATPRGDPDTALVAKDTNTQLALHGSKNAGQFLSQRCWKGLEPELGKTPVTKAVEGRKGIAISYEEEPT